ncbi:FAD-dependent oxidoreductase [Acidianus sulfidivorans JP7]|uniref:FAD-dependent oxidoreductase n=1 Tax=Acidianus sulfidivorans JP7 TaxID=619593 RepID=A0A2U9IKM5_9CREN|nr:FAD-dependent oxidoreductase [Acidianus sulfidivorans]AWR96579.1 FAD-dependent oxidoreductase [Acidianus sulfidivorans JP7]
MKVAIVGGGITGLFTAYSLEKEGVEVTIFEKAEIGSYSIHAAGLIEPYRFDKINTSEMIYKMLKYKINNVTSIKNVNKYWLEELLKNLNKNPPKEAWDIMKNMAEYSLKAYKDLSEEKNDFDYIADGLYEVYTKKEKLEKGIEEEKRNPFNPKFEVVDFKGFEGAIYFPELSRISTEKFIIRMKNELSKTSIENKEVSNIDDLKKNFDSVVITAGVWSNKFVSLPITAFKGYGYRVSGKFDDNKAVVLVDYGIAISPLSDYIKITGGFDADFSDDSSRAQIILDRVSPIVDISYIYDMNMGFRPCSPDGFPIIGKIDEKTVISTGACRLGWSYAPAIGKYTADMALGKINDLGYLSRYVKS